MSYRTTRRTFMSRFALHIEAYSVGSFRLDLKACYVLSISAKDAFNVYQRVQLPAAVWKKSLVISYSARSRQRNLGGGRRSN